MIRVNGQLAFFVTIWCCYSNATVDFEERIKYVPVTNTPSGNEFCFVFPKHPHGREFYITIFLTTPNVSTDYEIRFINSKVVRNGTITAEAIKKEILRTNATNSEVISVKAIDSSEVVQVIVFSNSMISQGASAAFLAVPQIKDKTISKYSYAIGADIKNSITVATCDYTYTKISYAGLASSGVFNSVSVKSVLSPVNDFNLEGIQAEATNPLGFMTNYVCGENDLNCIEHISEQIPPSYTWGYNFFVVPFQNRSGYIIKVWQRFEGTNFTIYCTSGSNVTKNKTISNLQFHEINNTREHFTLDANSSCCIQSNRPLAVMQYSDSEKNSMISVWIPPVSQYLNEHIFSTDVYEHDSLTPPTNEFHYIIVTVRRKFSPTAILLNGSALEPNLNKWYIITCRSNDICGYGISMDAQVSNYIINHTDSNASINVIVYGWAYEGDHEKGYAYPAGFGMNPVGETFYRLNNSIIENNKGLLGVQVYRSGDISHATTVQLNIAKVGANMSENEDDFSMKSVYFKPDATHEDVYFVFKDDILKPNETFKIEIISASGVNLVSPSSIEMIVTNDGSSSSSVSATLFTTTNTTIKVTSTPVCPAAETGQNTCLSVSIPVTMLLSSLLTAVITTLVIFLIMWWMKRKKESPSTTPREYECSKF